LIERGGMIALAATLGMLATNAALAASPNAGQHVTICHATGNPDKYVVNSPDVSGVVDGHAGASHQDDRDIIPPFDYVDKNGVSRHFPGQNWTSLGQAIYRNGCVVPAAQPITVFVTCILEQANQTYDAQFGCTNPNPFDVTIALGPDNQLSPTGFGKHDPPTTFLASTTDTTGLFVSNIPDSIDESWIVNFAGATSTATATDDLNHCPHP
jgi:hypothetical protein